MKLSVHSICIERRYPLLQAIRRAAELGYQGYEIDIGDFGNTGLGLHWPEEYTADHVARAAEAARAAGIEISSLCLGVLWRFYPTSPDAAVREQATDIIRQSASLASLAGAKVILLPVGQPEMLTPEQARDALVDVLKFCAPEAEKAGVIYAVENVGQALARSVDSLIEIVSRVNSPACQVYYDVGNATAQGGDVGADMRKLGKRIAMMHVKDWRRTDGKRETVTIGEGKVDWPAVTEAARDVGYDGYLTLEVPGTVETTDEILTRSRDALRRFGL
ncbi:MAG: sugar phosphate isomerase/epimerase family protein [Armatimonadota bacterium]